MPTVPPAAHQPVPHGARAAAAAVRSRPARRRTEPPPPSGAAPRGAPGHARYPAGAGPGAPGHRHLGASLGLWPCWCTSVGAPAQAGPSAHWAVYLSLALCLGVTALLSSGRIVRIVEDAAGRPLPRATPPCSPTGSTRSPASPGSIGRRCSSTAALGRPELTPASASPAPPPAVATPPQPPPAPAPPPGTQPPRAAAGRTRPAGAPSRRPPQPPPPRRRRPSRPPRRTTPFDHRAVSPDAPLRVQVVGDSFAEPMGYDFARYGVTNHHLVSQLDFHLSSGLLSPVRYQLAGRLAPDDVGQPAPGGGGASSSAPTTTTTSAWRGAGPDRCRRPPGDGVRPPGGRADGRGRRPAGPASTGWGSPCCETPGATPRPADANTAVAARRRRAGPGSASSTSGRSSPTRDGRFATFRPSATGEVIRVRQDDGIHLTRVATNVVAAWCTSSAAGLGRPLISPRAAPRATPGGPPLSPPRSLSSR